VLGGVIGGIVGERTGAIADVELPAGAVLGVRLERPLVVPRR
jgi:hypothetical protein